MSEFFAEYGLFLAKAVTVLAVLLLAVAGVVAISGSSRKNASSGEVVVNCLNDELDDMRHSLDEATMDEAEFKAMVKAEKKKEKEEAKARKKALKKSSSKVPAKTASADSKDLDKRVFVLDFEGDMHASAVELLREEISAVLMIAEPQDEVVVRLESAGGLVHAYGLASSQLERIKRKGIPLTICVDEVAASGGYMMACLADKLIAAPFAIVGSIGVVAQMPNFNRLLKKHDIDFDIYTAGEFKRTLTMFGENTEKGREKFVEELEETHVLFKQFVSEYRSQLDIDKVATGEIWFGKQALEVELVDQLMTSDEYLLEACENADVFVVNYEVRKSLQDKFSDMFVSGADKMFTRILERGLKARFLNR